MVGQEALYLVVKLLDLEVCVCSALVELLVLVDEILYGPMWGDVLVSIAGPIIARRAELQDLGWEVRTLDGLDHLQAMQAVQVLPILRSWLTPQLRS